MTHRGLLHPCREGQRQRGFSWLCTFPGMLDVYQAFTLCLREGLGKQILLPFYQDKQTYYLELIRDWRKSGSLLSQLWQSTSEGKDVGSSPGPRSLHWALYKLATCGMSAQGCAQEAPKLYSLLLCTCYEWLFPEMFTNVHKPFFNGHFNSSVNQTAFKLSRWLAVFSVFRFFCSCLPSAPFGPQWDQSAFCYSVKVKRINQYWSPLFLVTLPSLKKCGVTYLVSQACLQGLFFKDGGGNDLSYLHCEFPQHGIIDHSHLAITEQDLTLWTSYCPPLASCLPKQ